MESKVKELKERVSSYVDERRDETIELCSEMVKIPSENPPGDMSEMAAFIRGWLEDRGFALEVYEPEKGRISLVTRIGETKGPVLILNGHMDVVPAGDPKRWKFPPYCGEVKEGKVLGRGATDMKGGLTSLIAAFTAISDVVKELPGALILTIVPDEETGGEYGSGWLVQTDKIQGDACLIGEPSGIGGSFIGEKGLCWLRLEGKGIPAHGSLPMLGENAIEKLTRAFPIIHQIEKERVEIPKDIFEVIKTSKDFYKGFMREKGITDEAMLEAVAGAVDRNTVNIGVIKGGTKTNIVPESCCVEVDIRVPAGTIPDEVRRRVMELLEEANLKDIECKFILKSDPNYTPPTEKIYTLLNQNVKEVIGLDLKPLFVTGATDGRYFRLKGIPTLNYGPGELPLAHAYNEYVQVEDLINATKVIAGTIIDAWRFMV